MFVFKKCGKWSTLLCHSLGLPAGTEQEIFYMQGELPQNMSCFIHNRFSSSLSAPLLHPQKSQDRLPKTKTYFSWQSGSAAEPLTFCWFSQHVQVHAAQWIGMQHRGTLSQRSETVGVGFPFLDFRQTELTLKKLKGHDQGQSSYCNNDSAT